MLQYWSGVSTGTSPLLAKQADSSRNPTTRKNCTHCMTATWMMEALCFAGVLCMVRFLAALCREARAKKPYCVVYLSSQIAPSQEDALGPVTEMGVRSGRDDSHRRFRFEFIAGGAEPPVRRAG